MIDDIRADAEARMHKSLDALQSHFNRIRTGRAHPGILDAIQVDYYGSLTPLGQMANITIEDARTLAVTPWEKSLVPAIEKAIMKSGLGLNPATAGTVIRLPMPMLTEETRRGYTKQARAEAENARISIRNARRDAMSMLKDLEKDKDISEDDERRAQGEMQNLTDQFIAKVETALVAKEKDLLEV